MTDTTSRKSTIAAHGEYTTHGIPNGLTSLTPFLAVTSAREAIAFYRDVFGARVVAATEMGGVVVHADLDFGNGRLQLICRSGCQECRDERLLGFDPGAAHRVPVGRDAGGVWRVVLRLQCQADIRGLVTA
jgi:hypothetical protein